MIRRVFYYLFVSIFFLVSCNDDIDWKENVPLEEQDEYMGGLKSFKLFEETEGWENGKFRLNIMTEDGRIIVRNVSHSRSGGESLFKMNGGLKSGVFRLLSAEIEYKDSQDSIITRQYGLGGRIQIDEEQRVKLLSYYDSFMGLARDEDSTFIISSTAHLIRLRDLANNERTNKLLLEKNVYRQVGPIDMNEVIVDRVSGWMPIGLEPTTAFRGTFIGDDAHPIKNLKINRGNTLGVGLFGYVQNFTAKNVTLQNADVKGHSFAGILAGAVVTSGNSRDYSYFVDCELIDCKLQGADDGLSVGGLVGMVDQYADVLLLGCTTKNSSCVGAYNVGGFLGGSGRSSRIFMTDCVNENTPVSGKFHCVGGLIGVADSLSMSLCINKADVIGGTDSSTGTTIYGTGGLAGGAGTAVLLACKNFASVKGDLGVGGLIGSSRVATDEQEHAVFGNVFFQQCMNEGDVEGTDGVGGICGESQFGGHGLYNGGKVLGDKYVGGLCGKTSVAVAQNSINRGEVVGNSRIGGLIGIVSSGSITLSQNLGIVKASKGYVGGLVGLMGDNGIVHYCANYAPLECTGSSPVGGIVGEVGDPRKWSNTDITYCVFGAINMAMGPWSAAIDLAGFTTISTIDTVVSLVLSGTSFTLRTYFTYMESVKEVLDFRGCFDDVEFSRMNDEISKKEDEWRAEVDNLLAKARSEYAVNYPTDNGLNNTLLANPYMNNFNENLNYCTASEENARNFNANCNKKVNDLAKGVKAHEEKKVLVHDVISYVTMGVGLVATAVSMVATAGTSAFVVATVVGGASTAIGGANYVWRGVDNHEENAAIISQCVNVGTIKASKGEVGGIVGVLNDYCVLENCLNAGSGPGTFARQMVDEYGKNCSISKNLGMAPVSGWGDDESGSSVLHDHSNFMYCEKDGKGLDKTSMASKNVFKKQGWSIGTEQSLWAIPEGEYSHPIPNWSEMRTNN